MLRAARRSTDRLGGSRREAEQRLEALLTEAERAFTGQPKALWSDRTYLAPKDAAILRALLS